MPQNVKLDPASVCCRDLLANLLLPLDYASTETGAPEVAIENHVNDGQGRKYRPWDAPLKPAELKEDQPDHEGGTDEKTNAEYHDNAGLDMSLKKDHWKSHWNKP
jgi:hypothetical protein